MTNYKRGGIVLVEFGFSEGTGSKKRPALVISSEDYNRNRQEVIMSAITSNVQRVLFGDTVIDKWKEAGLLFPSLATGIIRTVKANMVIRKLGMLSEHDLRKVQKSLAKAIVF